jgi:hypothetical protein
MDWRVTTVARSSLVARCALTWSSADLASGASCSNFTSQHPLDRVQCGVDGGEIGMAVAIHECSHDRRGTSRRPAAVRNDGASSTNEYQLVPDAS